MDVLVLILLVLGLVCFLLAAFGWVPARVNLVAAGLAAWIGTAIVDWASAH